jgi:ABC-2 type transport system permease protein
MNALGLSTLFQKEVRRFMHVPGQTVLSPLITTTLYFLVFSYSVGARIQRPGGAREYLLFIVPGLIFLGLANNSFLNTSSSMFIMKIQGTIVDILVAPLSPLEILLGFVGGGMTRGLLVGVLTWAVATFFTGVHLAHPVAVAGFLVLSSYVFSVLGLLAAIWADKFEQVNFFPTFVMMPLTFLGGVFYAVSALPEPWRAVSLFNPMVYMVEGLRFGMLGTSSFSPSLGALLLTVLSLAGTGLAHEVLRRGYKLKQ